MLGRMPRTCKIRILPISPRHAASFSVTAIFFEPGETFRQPDLARTLQRISEKPDDFYHGALARELAAALQKGGALITAEDLANYLVKEREPIRGTYRGDQVIGAPPPSSAGIALVEISTSSKASTLGSWETVLPRQCT